MTFPQHWDGTTLTLNLLLVPAVDPLVDAVAGAAAPFADRVPDLGVVVIPSLDTLPTTLDPTALRPVPTIVAPAAPVPPRPGFERLEQQATAEGVAVGPPPAAPAAPVRRIRKALPGSYLAVTGASPTGDLTTTTDDFGCEVRGEEPGTVPVPRDRGRRAGAS